MKRILSAFIALTAVLVFAGCENKKSSDKETDKSSVSDDADGSTLASTQPDPLDPAGTTTNPVEDASEKTTAPTTEAVTESSVEPDTDAFSYNEDGAVIFENSYESETDETLIAAAQSLFESACRTEWSYTVGCPYDIDAESFIENDFKWRFYRITDSGIKSFADLEKNYYKVFSKKYPNKLHELYIESDGSVYALSGTRGADIFYVKSVITGIESQSDDEIFFTVENHYSGTDTNVNSPNTTTETFSVVIESDGAWRAGKFNLPY